MKNILFLLAMQVSFFINCLAQNEFSVLNSGSTSIFVASSFISNSEGWLADHQSVLWHTTDGGMTLDTVFTGKKFVSLDFTDSLNGFAVAYGEAFKTTDGGKLWQSLNKQKLGAAICFLNSVTGFLSGYQTVYMTTDGGYSFSSVEIEKIQFNDYYFLNDSVGIATASDDSLYRCIWRTADGGSAWNHVYEGEKFFMNSVWFINDSTGFAAGHYNLPGFGYQPAILRTTDGGMNWEAIYNNTDIGFPGESLLDIRFKNEQEGFAVSSQSLNVITLDGGLTWEIASRNDTLGLPSEHSIYRVLDGYEEMYLSGEQGYVVKWE